MSNMGKEIEKLLETASAPAPDATRPLKKIGDGNMFDGIRNIYDYAEGEGEKKGIIEGVLAAAGTVLLYKGASFLKRKYNQRKAHKEMGEKIYDAFNDELSVMEEESVSSSSEKPEECNDGGEENANVS